MISPRLIVKLKRSAIACMAIALAITSSMLFMKTSPRQDNSATQSRSTIDKREISTATPGQTAAVNDHLASVAVIMLNNDKEMPLAIRVGDKNIEIPGPSSWPNGSATGSEKGRFLAGIIDTADVLKANGFKPDETYSFVVGGTALNASNTFRVTGNHQTDLERSNTGDYTEEYHSNPDEAGIWRSLKFKNIVLSYGQIPSLADFLVAPHISPAKTSMPALNDQSPAIMGDSSIKTAEDVQKYREDLNNPDPAIRAQSIQNLILFSDPLTTDKSHPGVAAYIEKALADNDPSVRDAALRSLDLWDGDVPMQTLSKIVLNDQSPELRMHALSLLVDRFDVQAIPTLQQASHDPDTRVAQKAGQLLDSLSQ
jgi:hypothetical protein